MIYLITGGAGSFGRAITRELLNLDATIRIYDHNEHAQVTMKQDFPDERLRFLIGDIRDKDRLYRAMNGVDYVVHCAALKHVEVCEYDPMESVKTNIIGSMNVVDAAIDNGVKKVLVISTDKAVYPCNIYGATKLAEESLIKNANVYGKTRFACLRPGNFLQSSGNVFEKWDKQSQDGYCELTDDRMMRYFIDIQKAANLAVKCLQDMSGGEIFIPHMKEFSMLHLLKEKYPGAEIRMIGLREGERLHEPLYTEDEAKKLIDCEDYYVIR
jgi:FlaA1/EpsC-like NDP-sugar epimerase